MAIRANLNLTCSLWAIICVESVIEVAQIAEQLYAASPHAHSMTRNCASIFTRSSLKTCCRTALFFQKTMQPVPPIQLPHWAVTAFKFVSYKYQSKKKSKWVMSHIHGAPFIYIGSGMFWSGYVTRLVHGWNKHLLLGVAEKLRWTEHLLMTRYIKEIAKRQWGSTSETSESKKRDGWSQS